MSGTQQRVCRKRIQRNNLGWLLSIFLLACIGCGEPPSESPIATWQGGQLNRVEYERWLQYAALLDSPVAIRDLVTTRHLANMAREQGLHQQPMIKLGLINEKLKRYGQALQQHVMTTTTVDDEEVNAMLAQKPDAFQRPRKLKLRHIFKRLSQDPQQDAALHHLMADLRNDLIAGDDFQVRAREVSDSQTRFTGGNLGFLDPDTLPDPVRKVVATMEVGDISPVVEHRGGLAIFYCEDVRQAKTPSTSEVKEKVRLNLQRYHAKKRVQQLIVELTQAHPLPNPLEVRDGLYTLSETLPLKLTPVEMQTLIAMRSRTQNVAAVPAQRKAKIAQNWLLGHAIVDHVDSLGLSDSFQDELQWNQNQLLATRMLQTLVQPQLEPADPEAVRAYYDENPKRFQSPAMFHVAAIFFGLSENQPERLKLAQNVVRQIETGDLSFAEAAKAHSQHRSAEAGGDLGWRSLAQLGNLGPDVVKVTKEMQPGDTSGLFRLESGLWVFQLIDSKSAQPLTFEQARSQAERAVMGIQARNLERKVNAELLADMALKIHHEDSTQ